MKSWLKRAGKNIAITGYGWLVLMVGAIIFSETYPEIMAGIFDIAPEDESSRKFLDTAFASAMIAGFILAKMAMFGFLRIVREILIIFLGIYFFFVTPLPILGYLALPDIKGGEMFSLSAFTAGLFLLNILVFMLNRPAIVTNPAEGPQSVRANPKL